MDPKVHDFLIVWIKLIGLFVVVGGVVGAFVALAAFVSPLLCAVLIVIGATGLVAAAIVYND